MVALSSPKTQQNSSGETERIITLDSLARRCLLGFTTHLHHDYKPSWHHALIASKLDEMMFGDLRRLMIFCPPQHGKSELTTRYLPAFILGHNPRAKIIGLSYNQETAKKMNKATQRIMDTDEYRELFPNTVIPSHTLARSGIDYTRTATEFEVRDYEGGYFSAGMIDGAITSRPMEWGIIDDPYRNAREANSAIYRQRLLDFYSQAFLTRQNPETRIILVMTRWTLKDLAGILIERSRNSDKADQWEVMRLPAIAEDEDQYPGDPREPGEPLWEGRFPIDFLEAMRANMHPRVFVSMYQGRPPKGGEGLFDSSKLEEIDYVPDLDRVVRFYDLARTKKKTSDHTASVKQGITSDDNRPIVIDVTWDQLSPVEVHRLIVENAKKDGKKVHIVIEGESGSITQMDYLMRDPELNGYTLLLQTPRGDKYTRATPIASRNQWGEILILEGSWNEGFSDEIDYFTGEDGGEDDRVDALSGGYKYLTGEDYDDDGISRVSELSI